jgi:L-alanine-DL-glutamate epimerase-like enolase superfamily enzyme
MNAVILNPHPFLEFSIDQDVLDPFTRDFFYPQVEVDDGRVKIPEEPGWGISINTSWLEKAAYTLSELNS